MRVCVCACMLCVCVLACCVCAYVCVCTYDSTSVHRAIVQRWWEYYECSPALVVGWCSTVVANSSEARVDLPASLLGLWQPLAVLAMGAGRAANEQAKESVGAMIKITSSP